MKNPPKVKTNDRVRVVLEGVAHEFADACFQVGWSAANPIISTAEHVLSVEVLPPPVEVFGPGDSVCHATSRWVYSLGEDGYWSHAHQRFTGWIDDGSRRSFTSEYYERVEVTFS